MRRCSALVLAACAALAPAAQAALVDIAWKDGAFSHKATVAPKKFLELCGKLRMGEGVAWRFSAAGSTDFNIHYHVGKDVIYPEQKKAVTEADGTFAAPLDQDYCWMWTNVGDKPVEIGATLSRVKASP